MAFRAKCGSCPCSDIDQLVVNAIAIAIARSCPVVVVLIVHGIKALMLKLIVKRIWVVPG